MHAAAPALPTDRPAANTLPVAEPVETSSLSGDGGRSTPRRPRFRRLRRYVKAAFLFIGGIMVGKTVELPTERALDRFLADDSCPVQPGFRIDPLPPGEHVKLRILNRSAPAECLVLTLELKNDSSEEATDVEVIVTANDQFVAHTFPRGFVVTDPDGAQITELHRHFSHEQLAQFSIRSIPSGEVFRAYFITAVATKLRGYCKCGSSFLSSDQWSRNLKAPEEVLPFEYSGFEP